MVKWYKKKKRKKAKAKATKHFRKMQKGYEASVLKSISSKVFCLVRSRQAVYLISQTNPSREQTGMCQLGLGGATLSS